MSSKLESVVCCRLQVAQQAVKTVASCQSVLSLLNVANLFAGLQAAQRHENKMVSCQPFNENR